jgi:transposase
MAVAPWIVSDELWVRIEPLLPKVERRFRYPGRRRLPDRQALQGILFVLHTGIAWRHLPVELGFGGGSTCYRRMDEWQRAGVWERLHAVLLGELRPPVSSSGRGRLWTQVTCRRKRGLRDGPEPG